MEDNPKTKIAQKFRRLKRRFFSRYMMISLLLGGSLWVYSNMNLEFVTYAKIPLIVKLPSNRAVENPLPSTVSVEVRGTGWHIFNLLFFNSTASCLIDLSKEKIKGLDFEINQDDILKNLQNLGNVQAFDVIPPKLTLVLGQVGEYSIPVVSQVSIYPKSGFIQVGKTETKPDMINIHGYDRIVRNIKSWSTEKKVFRNVFKSVTNIIPLNDSLNDLVELSQRTVKVKAEFQLAAEQTYRDIKVYFRGGSLPLEHKIVPDHINVTLRGGVNQISKISRERIIVTIELQDLLKDSTGIIIPEITAPDDVTILNVQPRYVYHFRKVATLKNAHR